MENVILNTPCGQIKGTVSDGVRRFLGIKYATAGRWEYPKEVTEWQGVYEALQYGPAPIQARTYAAMGKFEQHKFYYEEFWEGVKTSYSEDCLNLNIWTPENPENCPVLITIYGGGLVAGQADELEFNGSEFAKRGIILVNFNYRVNIFGGFTSEELDKEAGKSGNYTLYDQRMACQWVKKNIGAFGGNAEQITLIGQSAGASSVETQIKTSGNEGMFQGAIIQSSAGFTGLPSWIKPEKKDVQKKCSELFIASGCQSFEEFRNLPAEAIFDLWRAQNKGAAFSASTFSDDVFKAEDGGKPAPVNVLCGITSEDTAPAIFYWVTKRFAKKQRGHHPVYAYYFNRQLPGDEFGAWHSSDLWYTYGTLAHSWRPFTDEDKALSEMMMDYFAAFIRTGNPNVPGRNEWLPLNAKQKRFMSFNIGDGEMRRFPLGKKIWTTLTYKGPRA